MRAPRARAACAARFRLGRFPFVFAPVHANSRPFAPVRVAAHRFVLLRIAPRNAAR
ncbi:conserved hypothetical protein [Burkholderia pseudomallei Pakistan 9]|nr:hypothetical protein BURPSS13_H0074 [Burkholderia pseudomallei S13]EEH29427.1 conserved hypothetical protein [Burkholderia pseudomallei Pakistan 9]